MSQASKVAIVTGASAGIGLATARQLAEDGARVALVARRASRLRELLDEWPQKLSERCIPLAADVTRTEELDRVVAMVQEWVGPADILVQAAGGSRPLPLYAPDELWDEALELNFGSIRRLAQRVLPPMMDRGWGRIISVSGGNEPSPMPVLPPGNGVSWINGASAAKAALHSWSKGLSRHVGASGVTVNCVAPGRIVSEQVDELIHPSDEERQDFIAHNIPLGRFGRPEECAKVISFLASEGASYVTGEIVSVDGGLRRFAF